MRKYLFFAKANMQSSLAYRGQTLVWLVGNILSLLIMVMVWLSASGGSTFGSYTKSELITYYILSLLVQWTAGWFPFYSLQEQIKNGNIVGSTLLKPVSLFGKSFGEEAGWRVFSFTIGALSTVIFALMFKDFFVLSLDFSRILLVLTTIPIAVLVTFTFSLILGMLGFFFTEIGTVDALFWVGRGLLGGQGVPISFVPQFFEPIVFLLPFRYMFSFPLEVYFGKLDPWEYLWGLIIGISWIVLLSVLYKAMWERGRRAYTSFGS